MGIVYSGVDSLPYRTNQRCGSTTQTQPQPLGVLQFRFVACLFGFALICPGIYFTQRSLTRNRGVSNLGPCLLSGGLFLLFAGSVACIAAIRRGEPAIPRKPRLFRRQRIVNTIVMNDRQTTCTISQSRDNAAWTTAHDAVHESPISPGYRAPPNFTNDVRYPRPISNIVDREAALQGQNRLSSGVTSPYDPPPYCSLFYYEQPPPPYHSPALAYPS